MTNETITTTDTTAGKTATTLKKKPGKKAVEIALRPSKTAKTSGPTAATATASPAAATTTKSATVLKLLRRKKGAAIAEIGDATGWQAHSVRGFISAVVKKRMGLEVKSEAGSDGVRRYTVQA